MTLPFLLSVPHAGLDVPAELESFSALTPEAIVKDGDEGAGEIYDLERHVRAFQTTQIARAFVDLNRGEDDRRRDGVVKTHTCWNVPVYRQPLPDTVVDLLLERYHRPYHQRLTAFARDPRLILAIDCHTMAGIGPPVGPDAEAERPWICLSNGDGTCPTSWIDGFSQCFRERIDGRVSINEPFRGGYITRRHGSEMPWIQLEMSRAVSGSTAEKRGLVLSVLEDWYRRYSESGMGSEVSR